MGAAETEIHCRGYSDSGIYEKSHPDFELRRYDPFLVAETDVNGDFDEVGNQAFRILAAYIFGENKSKWKRAFNSRKLML